MIFVNSMSDLFHKEVPKDYISKVFTTMERANWHIYQVLTKRFSFLEKFINERYPNKKAPVHMWFGVSIENRRAVSRLLHLQNTNARIRFLSIEPLIAPVGKLDLKGIDWVITGGESGPGARPIYQKWFFYIRNLCVKANVAFFFKQWGGVHLCLRQWCRQKKKAGRILEGRTWNEMPGNLVRA
jgi:protein gp37